jgi:outer membrane protein OmpA-like peptidoglycan-associated protein
VLLEQSTIQFTVGSAAVRPASDGVLDRIAREALACPGVLRIEGYTDSVGAEASNLELSRKRAEAVLGALLRRGVPGERLIAEGYGADKPVADNTDGTGRARNRRIEIRVVRPGAPSPT